jgi:ribosomal protein S18 acetylase RimI-like enzyme
VDDMLTRPARADELPALVALIAELNALPAQHCLICSHDAATLVAEIEGLARGEHGPESFFAVIAHEGGLVGAMGCDCNDDLTRGWLWGPWLRPEVSWQPAATRLMQQLRAQLPHSLRRIDGFCDVRNERANQLYRDNGFVVAKLSHVYIAHRKELTALPAASCAPIAPEQHAAVVALHDATFPGTYRSGAELIALVDDTHRLFVAGDGASVQGYLFVGIEEDPHEAYIHFLGVQPEARGRGIGKRLLHTALHWAFVERGLPQAALTVEDERGVARSLYESAGFRLLYTGVGTRLDLMP